MIGLIDCNNFFVSCERLFRPDLTNRPVLVLSSNDGCVVSRSQEVKDIGIPMGVPYFQIKDICKKERISVFSSNFSLYRDISERIVVIEKAELGAIETYSIDESFFIVPDHWNREDLMKLRALILRQTGIPVSIGVGHTKTHAKLASRLAKKDTLTGVYILDLLLWEHIREETQCASVWGMGRQTTFALAKLGIRTVSDFLIRGKSFAREHFGVVGERLFLELSGVAVYAVGDGYEETQQSYTSTRSFGKVVTEKETLMSALVYHTEHVAQKLRIDKKKAGKITLIARGSRYGDFGIRSSYSANVLVEPTNDTFTLIEEVRRLLERHFDPEIPYKKAGVVLSDIREEEWSNASLFESFVPHTKREKLLDTIDTINARFGKGTVGTAHVLRNTLWKEANAYKSHAYTTSWQEIPQVKAV